MSQFAPGSTFAVAAFRDSPIGDGVGARWEDRLYEYVVISRTPPPSTSALCRSATYLGDRAEPRAAVLPSSSNADMGARVPEPVRVPTLTQAPHRFEILQRWEGVVESASEDEFEAEISDLTDPSRPNEVATFRMDDVSFDDRALVVPGAAFYWCIGYFISEGGQRSRSSMIRFRRLPLWTQPQLRALRRKGEAIGRAFRDLAGPGVPPAR